MNSFERVYKKLDTLKELPETEEGEKR